MHFHFLCFFQTPQALLSHFSNKLILLLSLSISFWNPPATTFTFILNSPGPPLSRLPDLLQHPHADRVHRLRHMGELLLYINRPFEHYLWSIIIWLRFWKFHNAGFNRTCRVLRSLPEVETPWVGSTDQVWNIQHLLTLIINQCWSILLNHNILCSEWTWSSQSCTCSPRSSSAACPWSSLLLRLPLGLPWFFRVSITITITLWENVTSNFPGVPVYFIFVWWKNKPDMIRRWSSKLLHSSTFNVLMFICQIRCPTIYCI